MSSDPFRTAQNQDSDKKKCPIPRIEATLRERGETDKLDSLTAAMATPKEDIYGTVIRKVLVSWGFNIGCEAVQRHRRGACACD